MACHDSVVTKRKKAARSRSHAQPDGERCRSSPDEDFVGLGGERSHLIVGASEEEAVATDRLTADDRQTDVDLHLLGDRDRDDEHVVAQRNLHELPAALLGQEVAGARLGEVEEDALRGDGRIGRNEQATHETNLHLEFGSNALPSLEH